MVRVSLQSLMRMTSRSQFGGKNIADKVKTDLPGLSKESLKHNWGVSIRIKEIGTYSQRYSFLIKLEGTPSRIGVDQDNR